MPRHPLIAVQSFVSPAAHGGVGRTDDDDEQAPIVISTAKPLIEQRIIHAGRTRTRIREYSRFSARARR
jgi:hypothetical protein